MNTAGLIVSARRDALHEAAAIVEKFSDQIMKKGEREHSLAEIGEGDWARYEELESMASLLGEAAKKIRNRARRRP